MPRSRKYRWRLRCELLTMALLAAGCGDDERAAPRLPTAPVEILIDDQGIGHVFGHDDRDAFYGAGYLQASHRLFQMEMARRRAHGRWSEVLGASTLGDDRLARLFDWRGLGLAIAAKTKEENAEEWSVLEAWTAGVNRRIDEIRSGQAPLPYGFAELDLAPETWLPSDPLVIAKMTGFGNDLSLEFEIFLTLARNLYPAAASAIEIHRPAHDVFTVAPEDLPPAAGSKSSNHAPAQSGWTKQTSKARMDFTMLRRLASLRPMGSNNWAIDGRFTADGRSLLANDPHQGLDFPGVFYALHINSADAGGTFDVAGFTFPGTAGVSLGHSRGVAWAATTAFADVMDTWEVPRPDELTVVIGGDEVTVVAREEVIGVRDADDEAFTFYDVPEYGKLLPNDLAPVPVAKKGHVLLHRWTGYRVDAPARLLGINRANDIDELEAAVDLQRGFNFNLVAADRDGITHRVGIDVPVRDASHQPWLVMDGTNSKTLWSGEMLDRELLPRGRARERGWIATANNDPFGFTANGRVDDDPWYFGPLFAPGWRAKRITDELARLVGEGSITVDDVIALQLDTRSMLADDVLPLFQEAWDALDTDDALTEFRDRPALATLAQLLLSDWNRQMNRDSSGALAFHAFVHLLTQRVLADDLALLFGPAMDLQAVFMLKLGMQIVRGDYGADLLQQGRDVALLQALSDTAAWLESTFGSVDPAGYELGDMHQTSWKDSLGAGLDFGASTTDGGESSVNVSPSTFFSSGEIADEWTSHYGPIFRIVTRFREDGVPEMRFNFPLGNIVDPASPHFDDQLDGWVNGKYRVMPFLRSDVEARTEQTLILE